jgi:hypothetical protein
MIIYTMGLFEKKLIEFNNIKFTKIKNRYIVCADNTLWIIRKIFKEHKCIYENNYDLKNNFFLIQFLIDNGENIINEKLYDIQYIPELNDDYEIHIDKFSKTALKYIYEND